MNQNYFQIYIIIIVDVGAGKMGQESKEYQYSQVLDILAEMVASYLILNNDEKSETE